MSVRSTERRPYRMGQPNGPRPVDDIAIPPAPDTGTRYRHLVGYGWHARRARFWRFVREAAEWGILALVLGMVLVLAGHAVGWWA